MKIIVFVAFVFCILSVVYAQFDLEGLLNDYNGNTLSTNSFDQLTAAYNHKFSRNLAIFSAAAYCARHHPDRLKSWITGHSRQSSHKVTNIAISHNKVTDTWSYSGVFDKKIVVAYTGSSSVQNWITNLSFKKTSFPACSGCEVHGGFHEAYKQSRQQLIPNVNKLLSQFGKNTPVYITGHSLGGALATLAIADAAAGNFKIHNFHGIQWISGGIESLNEPLESNMAPMMFAKSSASLSSSSLSSIDLSSLQSLGGTVVSLPTLQMGPGTSIFGAPRVGNTQFSKWVRSKYPNLWRVTHHQDPVPRVPLQSMGFQHVSTEVYYDAKNNHKVCSASNPEDPACSLQHPVPVKWKDHTTYAGYDFDSNNC